jgi:hypothetical protein
MSKLIDEAKKRIMDVMVVHPSVTWDELDKYLAPLAEAAEVVELIHSLGNVTIIANRLVWPNGLWYSVRVRRPSDRDSLWSWGTTLLEALRKATKTQEET